MPNVLFVCAGDWEGSALHRLAAGLRPRITGSAYVRFCLPASALGEAGWGCKILPFTDTGDDGSIVGKGWFANEAGYWDSYEADVVVTQRWMNQDAAERTRNARASGQVVLADVDDHYWALDEGNPAFLDSHPKHNAAVNRDHYWRQLAACDGIICSTPTLQKYLSRLDVPVWLRRNMIETEAWEVRDVTAAERHPRIGWTGATAWRSRDLTRGAQGAVGPFVRDHALEFAHVGHWEGAEPAAELLDVPQENVVHEGEFVPMEDFPDAMAKAAIDVGIVPLEATSFNAAKSCLKGMEWAAQGVPFVASPLPEYEWFGVGLLAKSYRDWTRALNRMLDPEFRAQKGAEALERVRVEDYGVRGHEYVELFDELLA